MSSDMITIMLGCFDAPSSTAKSGAAIVSMTHDVVSKMKRFTNKSPLMQ